MELKVEANQATLRRLTDMKMLSGALCLMRGARVFLSASEGLAMAFAISRSLLSLPAESSSLSALFLSGAKADGGVVGAEEAIASLC